MTRCGFHVFSKQRLCFAGTDAGELLIRSETGRTLTRRMNARRGTTDKPRTVINSIGLNEVYRSKRPDSSQFKRRAVNLLRTVRIYETGYKLSSNGKNYMKNYDDFIIRHKARFPQCKQWPVDEVMTKRDWARLEITIDELNEASHEMTKTNPSCYPSTHEFELLTRVNAARTLESTAIKEQIENHKRLLIRAQHEREIVERDLIDCLIKKLQSKIDEMTDSELFLLPEHVLSKTAIDWFIKRGRRDRCCKAEICLFLDDIMRNGANVNQPA